MDLPLAVVSAKDPGVVAAGGIGRFLRLPLSLDRSAAIPFAALDGPHW
jgi:hypothetical protein